MIIIPFTSAKQMRFMFENHPAIAKKMADNMKKEKMPFPKGKEGKKK